MTILGKVILVKRVGRVRHRRGATSGLSTSVKIARLVRRHVVRDYVIHLHPILVATLITSVNFLPVTLSRNSKTRMRHPLTAIIVNNLVADALLALLILPTVCGAFAGG